MSAAQDETGRIRALILTIHGTNDGVHGPPGDTKWWEKTSPFISRLTNHLSGQGFDVDIEEHLWGGANSAFARQKGAIRLVRKLRQHSKAYDEIHLIGHSHGGNVAVDAARRAAWGSARTGRLFGGTPPNITSLITVGTPFLRAQARGSDYIYALAFVVLMLVSVLTFSIGPAITLGNLVAMVTQSAEAPPMIQLALSSLSAILLGVSAIMLRYRWARFRWIARLMRRGARRANLLSIWHPNDEAIGGLKRAESFSPELLPRGALWSGSHRLGAKLGSFVFVLFGLALLGLIGTIIFTALFPDQALSQAIRTEFDALEVGDPNLALIVGLSFLGLVAGALIALGLYAAMRLLTGALPEIFLRRFLNASGVGVLRAFAFGSDTGQPLGEVSERPHYYEGAVWTVPSPLAEKMEAETLKTLTHFLARHRPSLFGITPSPDWMTEIGQDAETWDSLIHTTYFDHPEIADRIAAHIAGAHDTPEQEEESPRKARAARSAEQRPVTPPAAAPPPPG